MKYKTEQLLRKLVFIVSTLVFVYQIGISTFNLLYPQVADTTEIDILQKIKPPLITICPRDQVNESKVKELGFSYNLTGHTLTFLMGIKKDNGTSKLSWGLDMNKTYEELLEYVLDGDADLAVSMIKDGKFYNINYNKDLKRKFYIGFSGYCWQLEYYDITNILSIFSLTGTK